MSATRISRPAPKLLWSGTWSAGQTKTVSGLSDYSVLACNLGSGATYIPAFLPPGTTAVRFYGGYGNTTPNQFLYTATFSRSASAPDTLTLDACHSSNVHGSTKTAETVGAIYGIC